MITLNERAPFQRSRQLREVALIVELILEKTINNLPEQVQAGWALAFMCPCGSWNIHKDSLQSTLLLDRLHFTYRTQAQFGVANIPEAGVPLSFYQS